MGEILQLLQQTKLCRSIIIKQRPPVALGFTLGVVHYGSKQMFYDLHSPLSESLRKELHCSEIIQCSPYLHLLHLPYYYLSFHYLHTPNISSMGCSYNIITYNTQLFQVRVSDLLITIYFPPHHILCNFLLSGFIIQPFTESRILVTFTF